MAGNNICPGIGFVEAIEDSEIARRISLICTAKRKAAGRDLTYAELDALVDAVPCRRTRLRLEAKKGRR
jgi:hypothetical protein